MDNNKLSKDAYGGIHGKDYVPYISNVKSNLGVNVAVAIIGLLLATLFAASTAYSGMKAGLTVAAGIPGAIVGAGAVAIFARKKGILGTNIIQGMSSGGESVASGIIFVLPAVLLIGGKINFVEGILVGFAGVLFGIGIASLVHNYMIVEEHGKLMYPESMAISETLVASATGGDALKFMGLGFLFGGVINFLNASFMGLVNNVISYSGDKNYRWKFDMEVNPLLLGIGFIVGLEVALTMFAGSVLANFAVNPLIGYFADMAKDAHLVWNNPKLPINQMAEAGSISGAYGRYIGAGMMIYGGIWGAIKLIPVMISALKETFKGNKGSDSEKGSMQMIILIAGLVLAFAGAFLISQGNVAMAVLIGIISLILMVLFVIVAGRLTGTIGTSNLPVSGMTIASLVIVTIVFVVLGWTTEVDNKILLMFGTLIVTGIAMSGGYLQSQKVTYIVGGNKNEMQRMFALAGLIGVVVVVGVIMVLSSELSNPKAGFALPQANLMAALTGGIFSGNLPWPMIIAGIFLAIMCHMLKLPIMSVAIGFYLGIATTSIILVGALIRLLVEKLAKTEEDKDIQVSNGISLSAGLVAGGSIVGLVGIIFQVTGKVVLPESLAGFAGSNEMAWLLLIILCILVLGSIMIFSKKHNTNK